jgi:hypothetical protein
MLDRFCHQGHLAAPAQVQTGFADLSSYGDLIRRQSRITNLGQQVYRRAEDGLIHRGITGTTPVQPLRLGPRGGASALRCY